MGKTDLSKLEPTARHIASRVENSFLLPELERKACQFRNTDKKIEILIKLRILYSRHKRKLLLFMK